MTHARSAICSITSRPNTWIRYAFRKGLMYARSLLAALFLCAGSVNAQTAKTYRIDNGRWFDGMHFITRTVYMSGGRFVTTQPADSVIDLHGQYVVPPFGEAHN